MYSLKDGKVMAPAGNGTSVVVSRNAKDEPVYGPLLVPMVSGKGPEDKNGRPTIKVYALGQHSEMKPGEKFATPEEILMVEPGAKIEGWKKSAPKPSPEK